MLRSHCSAFPHIPRRHALVVHSTLSVLSTPPASYGNCPVDVQALCNTSTLLCVFVTAAAIDPGLDSVVEYVAGMGVSGWIRHIDRVNGWLRRWAPDVFLLL